MVSFEGFGYASSAAALAQMEQVQGDVVFADQGTRVTLEQVQLGSLSDDMILV